MSLKEVDLSGGESIYCINEVQVKKARQLIDEDGVGAAKINRMIGLVESSLDRNERAALSFLLIERLLGSRIPA